ncbi:sensor histidine kinase KdpD [Paenibacillus sp. J22TS3]|uniref:sensor histidine kinase n=1 Tax=Paenibacillus sp. J22TS3 TaxID=2807192 RepID=UPI001B09EFEB|nr:sensor histidine kinase [Paenibacillus sp. J22TS3]GIP23634.1 two-component sensor histidine kinase [Paenibacillus sp. J22TS3]
MVALLSVFVALLLAGLVLQMMKNRQRSRDLVKIHEALSSLKESDSNSSLLVFTNDRHLQQLLNDMNRLINDTYQVSITQRKLEQSMRKMLSNISHDLKTPLTVVLGSIETVIQDERLTDAERDKLLRKVHGKAEEVLELINKFFDLAKLESGDKQLPLSLVNVGELCRRSILSFYDLIVTEGMEVSLKIPENPVVALANEEALNRVMNNLISNAIRYGNEGKIIGLNVEALESEIVIEVWDRGRGIKESDQDKVFERMYTLDDSRNKSYEGSGLGLTITKRLVEQMEGSISLRSRPYKRTVFSIRIPRMRV